jgi:hypothetical protein
MHSTKLRLRGSSRWWRSEFDHRKIFSAQCGTNSKPPIFSRFHLRACHHIQCIRACAGKQAVHYSSGAIALTPGIFGLFKNTLGDKT